jgi:uncharacterized protein
MIIKKEDIVELLLANKKTLRAFGASRVGLFGSYREHTNNAASDIDLIVEFEEGKKNFKNYTGAYLFLKELFQRDIDFLTPESLSPYIGPHILKSVEYVTLDS